MANSKGLIFLGTKSAILKEQLQPRILDNKRQACDISFSDFDDVTFKISCAAESLSLVKVNMSMRNLAELKRMGSQAVIDREFPGMETASEDIHSIALQFDCDNLKNPIEFLEKISDLKKLIFTGPMDVAFTALQKRTSRDAPVVALEYRKNENIFICPSDSKVVIIFHIDFQDSTDKAIAKVFLQEFAESQRIVRSAPPVSYSKDPPGELTGVKYNLNSDSVGFLSFALEGRHVEGARKETALSLLSGFRNYLHYHIKCTKTYLHMRMRHKGANWLQVLNRAIPEVQTEKKTIAGKTFVRK